MKENENECKECLEQARLLGMSAEREADLLGKLKRERDLADRLGNALEKIPWTFAGREEQASEEWNAITAWKEVRNEPCSEDRVLRLPKEAADRFREAAQVRSE